MYEEIMRKGSQALQRNHVKIAGDLPFFYSRRQMRADLFQRELRGKIVLHDHTIPAADVKAIRAVRDIENEVISANVGIIGRALGTVKINPAEWEELFLEGHAVLWEVMLFYTREDIEFSTFATTAIRNWVYDMTPNSKLYRQFIAMQERLTKEGNRASFEEVAQRLSMNEHQQRRLRASMVKTQRMTDGEDLEVLQLHVVKTEKTQLDLDQLAAIEDVKSRLNDWEKAVLDTWLTDGNRGWQSRVGARFGKSRAAAGIVKDKIIDMLRRAMPKAA